MKKKRILVVDDEKEIVDNLCTILAAKEYETLKAYDGEEALKLARREKPDLILLDIIMPKLNGYQVCRELKKDESTQRIPIIMITVKAQESDRFWAKEVGVADYVTKPIDIEEVLQRIVQLLEKQTV